MNVGQYVIPFERLRNSDVPRVGGKNASLGEMLSQLTAGGIRVPDGFATTADAFREFLSSNGLTQRIARRLQQLDVEDLAALEAAGRQVRSWVEQGSLPASFESDIRKQYQILIEGKSSEISVAVRSSATAEDLPEASFAGQQETFLNVRGIDAVLSSVRKVFASLYNDRAIAYRVHQGYSHADVALSAGVQKMVRSDLGAAGVMFTIDTESGFRDVVLITSSFGLGETVVQGAVNPDEFYVHKPMLAADKFPIVRRSLGSKLVKLQFDAQSGSGRTVAQIDVPDEQRHQFSLSDQDVIELARIAVRIEQHYGRPMDIEWGKDGLDGRLYVLQARPETVKSRGRSEAQLRYRLQQTSRVLVSGRAIGQKVGVGPARLVAGTSQMERVRPGDVLVTDMTDPNWEPVMKRAAAIVTNRGGRTCHAAIIARELGIPAVVGCANATSAVPDGADVTVSCAEGDTGHVYEG
ncbi:MAG TPA: phosphoenolpyruvate synthase, partial [Burkholderiaceae bacterium]|nr:phosphoenolpyruvate synthase [Burkholderiaceae bacterium]